jgi:hypothetical protein
MMRGSGRYRHFKFACLSAILKQHSRKCWSTEMIQAKHNRKCDKQQKRHHAMFSQSVDEVDGSLLSPGAFYSDDDDVLVMIKPDLLIEDNDNDIKRQFGTNHG